MPRLVVAASGYDEVRAAPIAVDPHRAGRYAAHAAQCPTYVRRVHARSQTAVGVCRQRQAFVFRVEGVFLHCRVVGQHASQQRGLEVGATRAPFEQATTAAHLGARSARPLHYVEDARGLRRRDDG